MRARRASWPSFTHDTHGGGVGIDGGAYFPTPTSTRTNNPFLSLSFVFCSHRRTTKGLSMFSAIPRKYAKNYILIRILIGRYVEA